MRLGKYLGVDVGEEDCSQSEGVLAGAQAIEAVRFGANEEFFGVVLEAIFTVIDGDVEIGGDAESNALLG